MMSFRKRYLQSLLTVAILFTCCLSSYAEEPGGGEEASKAPSMMQGNTGGGDTVLPDLFTGTMSYKIPIEVPPGRNGMDPGLALLYRSSSGNGWVGMGWELEVGAIERSTRNGVDYNGDNYLFRMAGATVELVNIGSNEYRAKIEGAFNRFVKDLAGYWVVTDKKGTRYTFGKAETSKIYRAPGFQKKPTPSSAFITPVQEDPNDPTRIFKWCLNRVEDTNGNYMTFSYAKDQGQIYLYQIDYTGNGTLSPGNYIKFNLESRNAPDMYTTNFRVKTAYRLKTIEVAANGNLVRKYELGYDEDPNTTGSQDSHISNRSLLTYIKQYGKDGLTALPAINLKYTPISSMNGIQEQTWATSASNWGGSGYTWAGDFNGDGRSDVATASGGTVWVKRSTGSSFAEETWATNATNLTNIYNFKLVGDFNGDGKTDIGTMRIGSTPPFSGVHAQLFIGRSIGNSFIEELWNSESCGAYPLYECKWGSSSSTWLGDFNGDGKTDIATASGGTIWVKKSTGSSFVEETWATTAINWGENGYTRVGDFNGDGKMDIATASGGTIWVKRSTGNSFVEEVWSTTAGNWGGSDYTWVGDFNGDGRSDIASANGGTIWVKLSTGSSFIEQTWATTAGSWGEAGYTRVGDFNGDGKTDIATASGGTLWIKRSTGSSFIEETWTTSVTNWGGSGYTWVGDFNGDGKSDMATANGGTIWVKQPNVFPVDLLRTVENGLGATTTITYTPSTTDAYQNIQLPFPVQTVSSVTTDDGNGTISQTQYSYYWGYYHIGERDFRGFNLVRVFGPSGPDGKKAIKEYWFHQGNDTGVDLNDRSASVGYMKGKPYRVRVYDGQWKMYSETTTSYSTVTAGPPYYFNPPYEVNTYICDGDSCGKQTKVTYAEYDSYGNVKTEYQYGDLNDSSDDRTVIRGYGYNTTAWIVGLPTTESVYKEIGPTGDKVAGTTYYYDGVADCETASANQIPEKGKLTRVVRWNSDGTSPETRMAYNSYGGLICSRDANGNTTAISYDGSYTFPTTVTNPLGQKTTTEYYGVDGVTADKGIYGQVKSVTDPNRVATTMEYDTFGRKIKITQPDGFWTTISYNNFGTVGAQYVGTDNSAGLSSRTYFDSLGRTILAKGTGPDGKDIARQTVYDSRGFIRQTSLPYFYGYETPKFTTYTYNPVGRVSRADMPDGTRQFYCYNDWVSVSIDANGHKKRETRDAYGRLKEVDEYTGTHSCDIVLGTPYATTIYEYDTVGNLRFVTDAKGNQTEIRYDTLGRKYYMKDPDMGNWSYYYDSTGNLTSQRDSMNQWMYFQYDKLNRLRQKDFAAKKPIGSGDVVYNYDENTSYGKGRLTSMTDQSGSATYYYDSTGRTNRVDKVVNGKTYTSRYEYLEGRLHAIGYPDGSNTNYSYNGPALSNVYDSQINYATYSGWNALGQTGRVTYGSGVTTDYTYYNSANGICPDDNYRLCTINTNNHGVTLQDLRYTYDDTGNITGINDSTPTSQEIGNEKLARLSALGDMTYTYPASGIRPHAATTAGRNSYNYDSNGNMKTGAGRTITYDYENMPVTITANGIATAFDYDGNGDRVKKTDGTNTTVYIGGLYECANGGCTKYIFANGQRIAAINGGATFYFHTDHLGSSSVITDSAGSPVQNLAYFPFGETRLNTGSVNVPYKYTGQELDDGTGLYNYNARLYDPTLGRFISADSIVPDPSDPQALNRYSYVLNNPLRYTDPTGHLSWDDVSDAWEDVKDGASDVAEWVSDNADEMAATAIVATTAAATWYCGGCGVASGALVGEIIGGYSANRSGGNVLQGVFIGGVAGGITGGMFEAAGIMTAGANPLVQIGAKGFVGGTISQMMGGRFETGFMYAAAAATLYWGYTYMAGTEPTMAPGEDLPNGKYEPNQYGQPPAGKNVAGLNKELTGHYWGKDFWTQGGPVSNIINTTPGGNALAGLHDYWMNNMSFNLVTNVGTMVPAAVMSYGAQLGGQLAPITVQQAVHDSK